MHQGMLVFAQVMTYLPLSTFRRCVAAHRGDHKVQGFSCLDQFFAMSFAQLTGRESLRDIEVNLRAQSARLYHMGFRCKTISRNTLANANAVRPWQMYADFAQHLIGIARPLYASEPLALELDATVYAFDATTIDLCLSVYPWAPFRSAKAAIKLHTLLDLRGAIPTFIHITDGKTHEVNVLDELIVEPGAYYLLDRGYLDFGRLFAIHQAQAFFVTRAKSNTKFKRRYSNPVDRTKTSVLCDQTGVLTVFYSSKDYPSTLRRVVVRDEESGKRVTFLTNNFALKPDLIAQLYRQRWQVELGCRLNEALSGKWNQFDRPNRVWRIPATNSKSKRVRSVPLNDSALEVLNQLDTEGTFEYLFVNKKTKKPYTRIHKAWHRIRKVAEVPFLRIHDLRHSSSVPTFSRETVIA